MQIPPLRERKEDIFPIAYQFLNRFNQEYGKDLNFSPKFLNFLERHQWPGNVRQLENLMERLVITVQDPIIDVSTLPAEFASDAARADISASGTTLAQQMDTYEEQIIRRTYERCGTTVALAKVLGISQATAVRKIAKYTKT